jgi:hypothetical protein
MFWTLPKKEMKVRWQQEQETALELLGLKAGNQTGKLINRVLLYLNTLLQQGVGFI